MKIIFQTNNKGVEVDTGGRIDQLANLYSVIFGNSYHSITVERSNGTPTGTSRLVAERTEQPKKGY